MLPVHLGGRERSGFVLAGSPGRGTDDRHAEVDDGAAIGESAHGLQFLCGGGQGGLDRGDLTEPAAVVDDKRSEQNHPTTRSDS